MFTKLFWRDTIERAVATAAQAALAVLGVDAFDLLAIDPVGVLSVAGGGAVLAILKALVASKIGDHESASLDPKVAIDTPGRHAA